VNRYEQGNPGDEEFQPGSKGRVLRNKLGIIDPLEIGLIESRLLAVAEARSYHRLDTASPISVELIQQLHRSWLSSLYYFAGKIRTVNLAKNDIMFAPLAYLEGTLEELDKLLAANTPCEGITKPELIKAIARVHAVLFLAHPFREGNGRISRWVADLMALQAGYPPLDWHLDVRPNARREEYFAAMGHGFLMNFSPLEGLVELALERAIRLSEDRHD